MTEIVDVVNDEDDVVGQKSKKECHEKGLLHRGSAILTFISEDRDQILLQKRSMNKTRKPGRLCIPGGHLEAGDTYLEGAIREYFEELYNSDSPVKDIDLQREFKLKKSADDDPEFMTVFSTVDDGDFEPQPEEVEGFVIMDLEETLRMTREKPEIFTETTCLVIQKYCGED